MKRLIILLSLFLITGVASSQFLQVSENDRHLIKDGRPFLWLGDTAWELFHKLDRNEADRYLQKRAAQGFTLIQAVILAELDGIRTPNALGDYALHDASPEKPNEAYFRHVDDIIAQAEKLGLVMGILPTWGDKLFSMHPGAGPLIFTVENAEAFGYFLGKRYKDKKVVWILGGDRNPANAEVIDIWDAMARGLKQGGNDHHLISYHPRGAATSSTWFHKFSWLDFNMYQSSHARHFNPVYKFAEHDYYLSPTKPVVDGEPAYEDIPVQFWEFIDWDDPLKVPVYVLDQNGLIIKRNHFKAGFFTDYDVRVHGYWNFLSGACGYTYGNNAVWQMFKKGDPIALPCILDWENSLHRPGANQIRYMRVLFEKRPFQLLVPDQTLVLGENKLDSMHIRAAASMDRNFILAYAAIGQPIQINTSSIKAKKCKGWWFNPQNGDVLKIKPFPNTAQKTFVPPTLGIGNDWMLILESKKNQLSKFRNSQKK